MIVAVLLLCASIVIIALVCDYYVHHSKRGRLIDQIPGPKTLPIIGNILLLCGVPYDQLVWLLHTTTNEYYPIVRIWNFFMPVISIRHPDDLETILNSTKHIKKSIMYTLFHPWLNTGLLTSGGDKWHSRRKILTPAFHFNILQQFVDIFAEEGQRMTKTLKDFGGTVEKDIIPFVCEYTLNAICETAMGTSLHNLGAAQEIYRQKVREIIVTLVQRFITPWLFFDSVFALSPVGRAQKKILKHLHGFTEKIIAERKLYHERTNGQYLQNVANENGIKTDDADRRGTQKRRLALLDLLIAAARNNNLSDMDIREEVDTFMFEGHDTTALGISFTLLLLAEHKDIQERVREEINNVMGQTEKFTIASLQNLTYLDRCVKESLRLYPSVHFIMRTNAEDVKLQSYLVPRGIEMHLHIFGVHRDANFWPNPNVFDPDRFLPEKILNRHPYSYLPFSAGPRNCIGQRFAMLEMKAMIASLVRNFYLEPVDSLKNMEFMPDLILRPKYPMHVKFVSIETA